MDRDLFEQLEALNSRIDVWIDEEDYGRVERQVKISEEAVGNDGIASLSKCYDRAFESGKTCTKGDDSLWKLLTSGHLRRPVTSVLIGSKWTQVEDAWAVFFWAKLLRAKIQQKGSDCYFRRLDEIVTCLERHLPEGTQCTSKDLSNNEDPRCNEKLSVLYLLEMASAGEGVDLRSFAERARRILKCHFEKHEPSFYLFYDLLARYTRGVGYFHEGAYRKAVMEFNYIIWITRKVWNGRIKGKAFFDRRLAPQLLYQPSVLYRSDVQLKLQLAFHTITTMESYLTSLKGMTLSAYKTVKKSLLRLEALQQMSRYTEAADLLARIIKNDLLGINSDQLTEAGVMYVDSEAEDFCRNLRSKHQSLLIGQYLAKLKQGVSGLTGKSIKKSEADNFGPSLNSLISCLREQKASTSLESVNRYGHLEQLAELLLLLTKNMTQCEDKNLCDRLRQTTENLYFENRTDLLPPTRREIACPCQTQGISLGITLSDETLSESITEVLWRLEKVGIDKFSKDREAHVRWRTKAEEQEYRLRWKKWELELTQEQKTISKGWGCEKCLPPNVSTDGSRLRGALDGLLGCCIRPMGSNGLQLSAKDYEKVMDGWDSRFAEYLEKRSFHTPVSSLHFVGLQRWNSTSPAQGRSLGGGYFVYYTDAAGFVELGIAIDPGFDFVRNLFHAGFSLADIDIVLLSHAHVDHVRDFESIVSLLLELKKQRGKIFKVHAIMTLGVYKRLEFLVENHAYREFIEPYIVDIEKEVNSGYPERLPRFHFVKTNSGTRSGGAHPNRFMPILSKGTRRARLKRSLPWVQITPVLAFHNDHSDLSDTFGFLVDISFNRSATRQRKNFKFGYTSDTKWQPELMDKYKTCDSLLMHIGSLLDPDNRKFDHYKPGGHECFELAKIKNHPYLMGMLHFLTQLDGHVSAGHEPVKLVLLSEFGEELRGRIRVDLAERLNKTYANLNVLPVDVGLDVLLAGSQKEACTVKCEKCEQYVSPVDATFRTYGHDEALYCVCDTCRKSTPEDVMQALLHRLYDAGWPHRTFDDNAALHR